MELQKNDKIEATIESLGYRGEGVARIHRVPVFIAGALPGERVRAHVILVKKDYAVANLTEVLSPSADRVTPRCPLFGRCGGCTLQHLSYSAQLGFKRGTVTDALKKIAHIDFPVSECVPSDGEYGYRNKLSLPVRRGRNGADVGFFAYNSHRIVCADDCPLQTDGVRALMPELRELAARFVPYDEERGIGELRHFVVRDLGGLSLTAVTTSDSGKKLVKAAEELGVEVAELWNNVNPGRNNVIMGERTTLVAGARTPARLHGMTVEVHPKGFVQVNSSVADKLYDALTERIGEIVDTIIDAYSGGGTLTAMLAPYAKKVIGVEIEPNASESAKKLADALGLKNVKNVCGDCAKVLPGLVSDKNIGRSLVVLDPPRSGCAREVISAVDASGAERVIYVSCNPSTLARDLALMDNYAPTEIIPFDMFPQTPNVETLVVLCRKY